MRRYWEKRTIRRIELGAEVPGGGSWHPGGGRSQDHGENIWRSGAEEAGAGVGAGKEPGLVPAHQAEMPQWEPARSPAAWKTERPMRETVGVTVRGPM